jgi:PAS domain S-box-containing protein
VNYVGAKVGGLFILEEDEKSNEKFLQLKASYAYERKKYITKRVEIGEGIIGQCYLEAHTIYMAKVPQNYLNITSGLGGANPSSLLVIPLRTNDKIEGVLELASLKPFKPHEIEFLEKLGELLASSIITVRTGEKTNQLLQISQEQAEEMRAQEEEMRQNMEELEATQEQMNRTVNELGVIKATLEKEKYLLDSLMDNIPDAIYFKDRESKFIRVSKYLAGHFSGNVDDLIGKSDFDFQDKSRAQQAYDDEKNIMATRKPKIDYIEKEVMTDGTEHWVSTTKMPLVNGKGEVVGTFGISRDVTRLKKLEHDVLNKDKSLAVEKKLYEDKIKTLETQLRSKQA